MITASRKLSCALLFFIICSLLLIVGIPSTHAGQYNIQVDFSFDTASDPNKLVAGYRLYQEGTPVCESDPSDQQFMACLVTSETGTFDFTMSALYSDQSESPQSPPFPFTISEDTLVNPLTAHITVSSQQGDTPFTPTFYSTGSTGNIASYAWSFGDGETASGPTSEHTYQTPGTYTATLTIYNHEGISSQSSFVLIATSPPTLPEPPPEPPTAVISSSTAIGNAPLLVQFDGNSSTANLRQIISYSWDFGDDSMSEGAQSSHSYTKPGNYQATLTVTDDIGLSAQATTPIIINAPPVLLNEAPTAVLSPSESQGNAPITIIFSATGSSDPDGTITDYLWNFGDGTSGTGATVEHSYTEAADYTVTLQVRDDGGETGSASTLITVLAEDESLFLYELGELEISHEWLPVTFNQPFNEPIIVFGPSPSHDPEPVTTRVRNVTREGFEVRLQEWDYQDGTHQPEIVSFFVVEQGVYELPDGTKVEAGSFTGANSFQTFQLKQPQDVVPVILTQVTSENKADAVTGRVRRTGPASFQYKLQEQERTKNKHIPEVVHYIAWQPGNGLLPGDIYYQTSVTPDSIKHNWVELQFETDFAEPPLFLADMQSQDGGDTSTIRTQSITTGSAQIKIEEEQSKDSETAHTTETAGYIVFGFPSN